MKIFLSIAKYLPAVVSGVMAMEAAVTGEKQGTTRKQVLLDAITAAAHVGEAVPDADVSLISTLIDTTVATFNKRGVFTTSSTAATLAPAAATN